MTTKAARGPSAPPKINALDLSVDQIQQIERLSGQMLEDWPRSKDRLGLYRAMYGVANDTPDELVGRMSLRALTDTISLEDPDDEEGAEPDPI